MSTSDEQDGKAGAAWDTTATSYEKSIANVSAIAADKLVELAHNLKSIDESSYVLDVGAGTGVVSLSVARKQPACKVLATDISPKMLQAVEENGLPNISTRVVDALNLQSLGTGKFTHIFSTFTIQNVTEPMKVLTDAYECLQPGGVLGLGVWGKQLGVVDIWTKACQTIDPSYSSDNLFVDHNAWRTAEELKVHFEKAGFEDIKFENMELQHPFPSTDAYMEFFFEGKNPAVVKLLDMYTGDLERAKKATRKMCKEQFGDGKDITSSAGLCVGRKAGR